MSANGFQRFINEGRFVVRRGDENVFHGERTKRGGSAFVKVPARQTETRGPKSGVKGQLPVRDALGLAVC